MATMTDPRRALGKAGEELASQHLRREGFAILARCARTAAGEVDLVAFAEDTIVFVEVKTRRVSVGARGRDARTVPLEAVRTRKRARVRRAGAAWLAEHRNRPAARHIRFDAIGVTVDSSGHLHALEHVRDAF